MQFKVAIKYWDGMNAVSMALTILNININICSIELK